MRVRRRLYSQLCVVVVRVSGLQPGSEFDGERAVLGHMRILLEPGQEAALVGELGSGDPVCRMGTCRVAVPGRHAPPASYTAVNAWACGTRE